MEPHVLTPARVVAATYVLAVGTIATIGAVLDSTGAIVLAGLLTLPTSVPAVIGYYLVYGLLAQVPGANPDNSSGSMSCSAAGECHGSSAGDLAPWFAVTTDLVGILALILCAVVNVVALTWVVRGRPGGQSSTKSRTTRPSSVPASSWRK